MLLLTPFYRWWDWVWKDELVGLVHGYAEIWIQACLTPRVTCFLPLTTPYGSLGCGHSAFRLWKFWNANFKFWFFFVTKWTESLLEAVGSTENLSISLAFPLFISQWYVSFWKFPHQASHNGIFPNCVTQYTLAETFLAINCQLQPPQDTLEEDQFLLALLGGDKGIQFLQTVSVTKNNWAAIFFTLHFNDNTITV